MLDKIYHMLEISIHALREEGDLPHMVQPHRGRKISIHALREEGDVQRVVNRVQLLQFLSTPSARRATQLPPEHQWPQ